MERLLDYFTPQNYKLRLHIDKESASLRGSVIITGIVHHPLIKLHSHNLKITSVKIDDKDTSYALKSDILEIKPITILYHKKQNKSIKIQVEFSTTLTNTMEGPYLSTYQYQNQTKTIVATQFESHYARRCFPCIDEPSAKATFDLTLITKGDQDLILSNTEILSQKTLQYKTVDENFNLTKSAVKTITTFKTTPKMSTYLLAFVIGEFRKEIITTKNNIKITTFCPLNHDQSMLKFANEIAEKSLAFYEDFFGTKYPLPKLDQVALPDFEAGAMENWGLITYRESCLLANDKTSQDAKESIATVIAHEISHQWFGNLVTMSWWDDLWLNESFATIMEYFAVDHIKPEYHIWQHFFTNECLAALSKDAYKDVQSVRQKIKDPAEIATLFDGSIVYAKGARLILMLIRTIGIDGFKQGIKDYFDKYAYQNTIGDHLWESLQPYAKQLDLKTFMHSWLDQPGYPILASDGSQKRFLTDQKISAKPSSYLLPMISDDLSGHYLLKLDQSEFDAKIANFHQLEFEQKLRLLIDYYFFSKANLISPVNYFPLLEKFSKSTDYFIWDLLALFVADLKFLLPENSHALVVFQDLVNTLVLPVLAKIDIKPSPNEPSSITKLRQTLLSLALFAEEDGNPVQNHSQKSLNIQSSPESPLNSQTATKKSSQSRAITEKLTKLYQPNPEKINSSVRPFVLIAKLRQTPTIFEDLLKIYQNSSDPELKSDLLSALTSSNHSAHQDLLLQLLADKNTIRPQDHILYFAKLNKNQFLRSQTLSWLYQNWAFVSEISGEKSKEDYLLVASNQLKTTQNLQDFTNFLDTLKSDPALARSTKIATAKASANLARLQTYQPELIAYLSKPS